jgi:hypothetical protein
MYLSLGHSIFVEGKNSTSKEDGENRKVTILKSMKAQILYKKNVLNEEDHN